MDNGDDKQKFHPTSVSGITVENAELGRLIARMRYDQMAEVLRGMSIELGRQAEADLLRGRPQLAQLLRSSQDIIADATEVMGRTFRLSRPFMEHEFSNNTDEQDERNK
jgi:hypothetical protein